MTMEVRRIRTRGGSRVEPPLDQNWSNLQKLEWQAAVTSADTGILVTVQPTTAKYLRLGRWMPFQDQYDVQFPGGDVGPFSYVGAWDYLSGVALGAELSRRCEP